MDKKKSHDHNETKPTIGKILQKLNQSDIVPKIIVVFICKRSLQQL